ncbi:MAG: type II toxin-antitoxin system RelE/ParE family toxin [Lachnospiraceae bacterium]|uniref:type II toxin-antitoxin system RelE/ParE family toxin n=1 Tax=Roseburia hominis TaxID=301301 RepID=UPI001F2C00F8|nr:type II toxin-antitoxin system RelE/ParE family toxin [Roseburia hominis]MCI5712482.1 type II toxin-antitoxin system RelE/ParE family toxin [Lachnospiraceae bacterium]MDD6170520.1 type II toxin-antitoxin system RelE/ParE family toxin [Lachnospiraceae bacterium]MDY4839226.1 type II toxin-antitoxin system RelE/ParE family toxin [Lachnospiraceae bacterium]
MRVRWTKPALEDLDDIENYIALDDAGRAADFVDKLIDLGESLEFNWERGTQAKWTSDLSIRELYYQNYTLIYEVLENEIQIHEVHNSAKMIRHFNR